MSLAINVSAINPPPRQLAVSVHISDDTGVSRSSRRVINAYFADLTMEQATLLPRALAMIPAIVERARTEHLEQTRRQVRAAFEPSGDAMNELNAQAWAHERWHEAALKELPCITLADAQARCELGPWDARSDLLVLSHQGRSHVPAFQFDSNEAPAAEWITLIAALRGTESTAANWNILAWLLRPHPLLDNCTPLEVQATNPQRVRQLARSNAREHLL